MTEGVFAGQTNTIKLVSTYTKKWHVWTLTKFDPLPKKCEDSFDHYQLPLLNRWDIGARSRD